MWARDLELALGVWLCASPLIFRAADSPTAWAVDIGFGTAFALLALGSYWRRTRFLHRVELPVAVGLLVLGWLAAVSAPDAPPPRAQNHVVVGFLLATFALVPNRASSPPEAWRSRRPRARDRDEAA